MISSKQSNDNKMGVGKGLLYGSNYINKHHHHQSGGKMMINGGSAGTVGMNNNMGGGGYGAAGMKSHGMLRSNR